MTARKSQPRHKNGTTRRGVVAFLDVGGPSGEAFAHRAKFFGRDAFGLFPPTLIPDGKGIESGIFPGRQSVDRSLPEKLPDQFN